MTESGPERPVENTTIVDTPRPAGGELIPKADVVILRETDLDCDLSTAIERVRQNQATSRSRILIVGDEEPGTDSVDSLPLPDMPSSVADLVHAGGEDALRRVARRQEPTLDSLRCFVSEARLALQEVDDCIENGSRAQLKKRVQLSQDVLNWIDAIVDEAGVEVQSLAKGWQGVETWELLRDAGSKVERYFPGLRVSLAPMAAPAECNGRASELAEAFFGLLTLMAHRIGGVGSIRVEVVADGEQLIHRLTVDGELRELGGADIDARQKVVREVIVHQHGGSIAPRGNDHPGTVEVRLPRRLLG